MDFANFLAPAAPQPKFLNSASGGSSTLAAPSADLVQALLGFPAAAGKPVTRATSIRVAAVLASVKTMANDIAKMPLILRETSVVDGRQRVTPAITNPLYSILKDVPNRWQTSFQLRWFLASQLIMNGNCFCQKITDQAGDIVELIPLNAWSMAVKWDMTGGLNPQKNPDGTIVPVLCWDYMDGQAKMRRFYQNELWHVAAHNIESNGLEGAALIALGKEAISVLIAAEETAGRNFANGLGMGGFISFPVEGGPTEEQAQAVVDRLKKDFSGSQNAGKFTILPGGGTWQKMTFNAQESQLLESRQWNEQEVARLFGGAPLIAKLGLSTEASTYAATAAQLGEYFHTTVLPYSTVIEQTITRDLIPKSQWGTLYAKHDPDVILYGSPDERTKVYAARIMSFQMTPNEAREKEGLPGLPGLDFVAGGTGTPTIAYPTDVTEKAELFLAGQLPPQAVLNAQADVAAKNAQAASNNLEAATRRGSTPPNGKNNEDDNPPANIPSDKKAKARLEQIANALAERVLRAEDKKQPDAKWIAGVMNISLEAATNYIEKRKSLIEQEARAALVALVTEE